MLDANNSEPQVGIEPTTACDQTLPEAPEGGVNRNQSKLTDAGTAEQSPNWRRETQPNRNLSPDAVSTPAPRPEALPGGREVIGYLVWDAGCGYAFRGHLYARREEAEVVRAGIAWHSRDRFRVVPVTLAAVERAS